MHQYIFVLVYCMSAKIFTTHPFNSITMFRLTYHSSSGQSEPNRLKSSNRHCFAFRQYPFKCKFPLRYFWDKRLILVQKKSLTVYICNCARISIILAELWYGGLLWILPVWIASNYAETWNAKVTLDYSLYFTFHLLTAQFGKEWLLRQNLKTLSMATTAVPPRLRVRYI